MLLKQCFTEGFSVVTKRNKLFWLNLALEIKNVEGVLQSLMVTVQVQMKGLLTLLFRELRVCNRFLGEKGVKKW